MDDGEPGVLTPRQRLALSIGTGVSATDVLNMDDAAVDFASMLRWGAGCTNLTAAGLDPLQLKHRGAKSAHDLRTVGFDALHLSEARFCASAIAAFGAAEVVSAFLLTPSDAVAIAGSPSVHQLDVSLDRLLGLCAGAPVEAAAVVSQTPPAGGALHGVGVSTLMDSGLRSGKLIALGYTAATVLAQTRATDRQLVSLGF